jgi:hypothetical protein
VRKNIGTLNNVPFQKKKEFGEYQETESEISSWIKEMLDRVGVGS